MDHVNRHIKDSGGRLPALMLAVAVTFLVFAAINAGFTPHATDLAARAFGPSALHL